MKYRIFAALAFWAVLAVISCNRDDISFDAPSQSLRFSRDTVFCDTVYNQVRSETYAVKVYNDENKDIMIPKISLVGGSSSLYRINVDGSSGTEFTNVPLRKKDSLYVFVEIAPVASETEAIAEDQVVFESPAGNQHVTLFSVVQDAEFFIESDTNPNILNTDTNWTNEKAKIIFGDLTVSEGKKLNIQPGTKVYFFKNSGLKISQNAELNINGTLGNEVIFRGDRNDTRYDTLPKNWNGIVFEEGSLLNMNYGKVFGGTKGLEMYSSTANIKNSIIHTFQEYGIYAVGSTLNAQNLVMNNCGEASIGIFKGGNITLTHSTIANYWNLNSAMAGLGIYASDSWTDATGSTQNGPLSLSVYNSIVYGYAENLVELDNSGSSFSTSFVNCLLKYGSSATYATTNSIKNEDPLFLNFYTEKLNLRVADDSPAKGNGSPAYSALAPYDIAGISRTSSPTIGAYQ